MCHLDGLSESGACRLCVVEVAGSTKLAPACTTAVAEGMEVTHDSEQLAEYRRTITEMLFLERNHVCAVCVANNHCELQDLAEDLRRRPFRAARHQPRRWHRRQPPAVRHRPQPLHHVRPLRAGLRRGRGRPHVGRHGLAASTRAWSPTWARRGVSRRPAPAAASASRSAPPARCSRRAARSPRAARQRRPFLPYLQDVRRGRRPRHDQAHAGHGLARRLLRLPHVVPGHGRAAARDRRARRHRLQPAHRRQGIPRRCRRLPRRGGRVVARRTSTRSSWCASARGRSSRSATARSPPTCPGMRNPIGVRPLLERAYIENVTLNPGHPDRRSCPALLPDGPAGPSGRHGRCLPARLSALGGPHLPRARRPARGTRPGHHGRPVRALREIP